MTTTAPDESSGIPLSNQGRGEQGVRGLVAAGATTTTTPPEAAGPAAKKGHGTPATTLVAPGGSSEQIDVAGTPWKGVSVNVATDLKVPILFGLAVALFLMVQALVDHRDPRLVQAPERDDDDTLEFQ